MFENFFLIVSFLLNFDPGILLNGLHFGNFGNFGNRPRKFRNHSLLFQNFWKVWANEKCCQDDCFHVMKASIDRGSTLLTLLCLTYSIGGPSMACSSGENVLCKV